MLQVKEISKKYVSGDFTQIALDKVSINFRECEFVSVLGPSGSGKTTLLNIVGGLDRYDSGDIVINGISTKQYKDRDWDSYRNHTVGFVFQSYNLIPHQSVLSNVELALTISGVSKSERRKRAKEALDKVGLSKHKNKRPNQLSGGQMQRVAIARALVNNPDILLADEPTGALDSETSNQVMELLGEVAKDRLVIMVTHNPELAEKYSTRIIKLKDGRVTDDTMPCVVGEEKPAVHKKMGKASMSWFTSLALSFNNLRTKKGRTIMTAFAGSIGIIGIALILSLSNGVQNYIEDIQRDTMSAYPILIEERTIDMSDMIGVDAIKGREEDKTDHDKDAVYSNVSSLQRRQNFISRISENNLTEFKHYLDDENSEIHKYIGKNGIVYTYNLNFGIYAFDPEGNFVNTNGTSMRQRNTQAQRNYSLLSEGNNDFSELIGGNSGNLISETIIENYDLLYGKYPENMNEMVLVLDEDNEVSVYVLYRLGLLPLDEFNKTMERFENGEEFEITSDRLDYEKVCEQEFYLIPACDFYTQNSSGNFQNESDNPIKTAELMEKAIKLKISGIIRPKNENAGRLIGESVGYTTALTDYIITYTENSKVIKEQLAKPEINVLNGMRFSVSVDDEKIENVRKYVSELGISEKASLYQAVMQYMQTGDDNTQIPEDEAGKAAALDAFMQAADNEVLLYIYESYVSEGSLEENLKLLGKVDRDAPASISLFADSFADKDKISECIDRYNAGVAEEDHITYTDYIGLLLSAVTDIVNTISYVLIAFVAVSLLVSSIMIGIITYISVLERTKEIGILRAMGASKKNITQVFNAETIIIGFFAGLIGVGITLLMLFPVNMVIHRIVGSPDVNASLPVMGAIMLILLSTVLTTIGGFIPAKKAAKKDPVVALRTE